MKELRAVRPETTVISQAQVEKQKSAVVLRPHNGHKCFEYNLETRTITLAEIKQTDADIKGGVHSKVIRKDGCLYTTALRFESADKKFIKMIMHLKHRTGL
jgi:hypothetical protein